MVRLKSQAAGLMPDNNTITAIIFTFNSILVLLGIDKCIFFCYYQPNKADSGTNKRYFTGYFLKSDTGGENDYYSINNYGYHDNGNCRHGAYGGTERGGNDSADILSIHQRAGGC